MFSTRSFARAASAPRASTRSWLDYWDLYRQRRGLAALSDAQLRDIGLSRDEAAAEAQRPLWDAPNHWMR